MQNLQKKTTTGIIYGLLKTINECWKMESECIKASFSFKLQEY